MAQNNTFIKWGLLLIVILLALNGMNQTTTLIKTSEGFELVKRPQANLFSTVSPDIRDVPITAKNQCKNELLEFFEHDEIVDDFEVVDGIGTCCYQLDNGLTGCIR